MHPCARGISASMHVRTILAMQSWFVGRYQKRNLLIPFKLAVSTPVANITTEHNCAQPSHTDLTQPRLSQGQLPATSGRPLLLPRRGSLVSIRLQIASYAARARESTLASADSTGLVTEGRILCPVRESLRYPALRHQTPLPPL